MSAATSTDSTSSSPPAVVSHLSDPRPPRTPSAAPLSAPEDEVQFHYLADRPEFLPAVAAASVQEWTAIYRDFYGIDTVEKAIGEFGRAYMNRGQLNSCVVVTVNGEFAGMAMLCTEDMPTTEAYYGTKPWMTNLYVSGQFRGRGIALTIANKLASLAEEWGYKHIWLITQHMQVAYHKLGWKSIETTEIFAGLYTVMRRDFPKNGGPARSYTEDEARESHKLIHPEH
jgi:GNAT superfamily N-acetyltransferase